MRILTSGNRYSGRTIARETGGEKRKERKNRKRESLAKDRERTHGRTIAHTGRSSDQVFTTIRRKTGKKRRFRLQVSKSCVSSAECGPASVGCIPVDTQQVRNSEFFPSTWPGLLSLFHRCAHRSKLLREKRGTRGKKEERKG